ncbi:MAG: hypothetical protein MUQ27_06970 [Acidimicrobiia bacterium]|nr:hypothetical protein [Acidimicrobiia bacterium]
MHNFKVVAVAAVLALVAAACGGTSATTVPAAGSPTVVHVTANEMTVTSDVTTFKVGVPYTFEVTNEGTLPHEVMRVQPTDLTDMEEIDAFALGMAESEDLVPGATVSFDYTFTEEDLAGPLELACHVPGHYEAGMLLPITVEA